MTKVICVNRKLFNKVLGYGSWGIITALLVVFTPISMIETSGMYTKDGSSWTNNETCYQSIVFQQEVCYLWYEQGTDTRTGILQFLLIINIIAISLYAYWKQRTFKLSWCLNND